ncbi:MAG: hypothetical protein ACREBC_37000, partial [Pyrinomonadaceae bacterium]
MTRKPNFWKFIVGVTVVAALFIATLASTSARLTSAKKVSTSPGKASTNARIASPFLKTAMTPLDAVTASLEL